MDSYVDPSHFPNDHSAFDFHFYPKHPNDLMDPSSYSYLMDRAKSHSADFPNQASIAMALQYQEGVQLPKTEDRLDL